MMKNLNLLVWITQLGLSVALPLAGCILLGLWLRNQFGWGVWVVILGTALGICFGADGLRMSLKSMERMGRGKKKEPEPPAFNDHH